MCTYLLPYITQNNLGDLLVYPGTFRQIPYVCSCTGIIDDKLMVGHSPHLT